MDYYVVRDGGGGGAVGLVVEEFAFGEDFAAVGLDCAGWIAGDRRWWSSAEFSRGMRGDPGLRERVVPAERGEAAEAYARLGGGELPGEAALRGYFGDRQPLGAVPPLRFGGDRRIYRLLCAKELDERGAAGLLAHWGMDPVGDPAGRLIGTARLEIDGWRFGWELRRVGPGVAWCVDLTAAQDSPGSVLGALLSDLKRDVRRHGLIPVTIERLA